MCKIFLSNKTYKKFPISLLLSFSILPFQWYCFNLFVLFSVEESQEYHQSSHHPDPELSLRHVSSYVSYFLYLLKILSPPLHYDFLSPILVKWDWVCSEALPSFRCCYTNYDWQFLLEINCVNLQSLDRSLCSVV